jgi:hypothetical protein
VLHRYKDLASFLFQRQDYPPRSRRPQVKADPSICQDFRTEGHLVLPARHETDVGDVEQSL